MMLLMFWNVVILYQARSKQCTIGPATVLWDHAHYLLINLSEYFFDTTVGPRPNLARMCG